ncbi:MAG: KEOPS complex subunit Cgi121 [Methanotrichaceae archaeon]
MNDVRLLFGRPKTKEKDAFLATLRDLQSKYNCVIQAMDADKVVSERHAAFAVEKAFRAFSEGRNVAKDIGLEILRYASGQKQIGRALSMGILEATPRVALILVNNGTIPEISSIIEIDGQGPSWNFDAVRGAFDIYDEEIKIVGEERIPDLVLERVALVDAYR